MPDYMLSNRTFVNHTRVPCCICYCEITSHTYAVERGYNDISLCDTSPVLTPWSRVLLEKLTGFQLLKKFPAIYGHRRFITAFTSARHLSLSWARSIQSIPPTSHFLNTHCNIILPFTPGSPQLSLSVRFPHQNPVYTSAPLDLIIRTILSEVHPIHLAYSHQIVCGTN